METSYAINANATYQCDAVTPAEKRRKKTGYHPIPCRTQTPFHPPKKKIAQNQAE
jgi:hypothetical protein